MNTEQLIKTLSIQSYSFDQYRMFAFIVRQLKEIDCEFFVYDGCIYVTKGNAQYYPCVVAHMDTVHKIVKDLQVIRAGNKLTGFNAATMQQTGIGGDDKVGIFIALECLKHFDHIKLVLFRDEEVGCDGSYNANIDFFEDCSFVLQCDRNGNKDFIIDAGGVALSSNNFQHDMRTVLPNYGYKFEHGMMTDVMALKESGLRCSCANISCGYYRPHSRDEYVNIDDVENCLDMVKEIIGRFGDIKYPHKYKKKKKWKMEWDLPKKTDSLTSGRLARSYWDEPLTDKWDGHKKAGDFCECCCETSNHTTHVYEYGIDMCNKCINDYIKIHTA